MDELLMSKKNLDQMIDDIEVIRNKNKKKTEDDLLPDIIPEFKKIKKPFILKNGLDGVKLAMLRQMNFAEDEDKRLSPKELRESVLITPFDEVQKTYKEFRSKKND